MNDNLHIFHAEVDWTNGILRTISNCLEFLLFRKIRNRMPIESKISQRNENKEFSGHLTVKIYEFPVDFNQ